VKTKIRSPKERIEQQREQAKRVALKALRRARKAAEESGEKLSEWEGEFLGSVEGRVEKYGRAFHDPEKGAPGTSLSIRQSVKLKEIAGKAKGRKKPLLRSKNGFGRGRAAI
jgi:hypothetical protein